MPLSAVLFDMDGLLVNTEPLWLQAEHATLAALGGTWGQADQHAVVGASMAHATAYMARVSGTDRSTDEIAEVLVDTMLGLLAQVRVPIQPGAAPLLTEVAGSGVPYALVSASVRRIIDVVLNQLAEAGLPGFSVQVAGDEVPRSKPDPLPYLHAADLLGVDITQAVVLEDSANGVRAGWSAGATVLAVPHVVPIQARDRVVVRESLVGLTLADLRALVP
ncbi:MAG: HAD family phosphatase [Candidatus Nanopelagicales bacterium]